MLNIGIIGTGGMACDHAKSFKELPGVRISACCDIFPDKAKAFAEQFSIQKWYTDFKKMLSCEKLDGVSVVSTDASHAAISLDALKRCIPVLCEKPMAVTAGDAEKMLAAAQKARVVTMINFSKRNAPGIQAARQYITAGHIGRIMHVDAQYLQSWLVTRNWGDWRTNPKWLWRLSTRHGSGGVLGDIGCHIYDMAGFLCGDIAEIDCKLKTFPKAKGDRIGEYQLDANDSFVSTVMFKNGALGTVHCSRWATGHINREYICVYGEKGAVEIDFEKGQSQYRRYDLETGVWETIACRKTPNNYKRFIQAIRTGKNDVSDFKNGLKIQKYIEASFKSDKLRRPIKPAV